MPDLRERIRTWMLPLVAAVEDPPAADEFEQRVAALAIACRDLPKAAWSAGSTVVALRYFERWPSVAAVWRFMAEVGPKL